MIRRLAAVLLAVLVVACGDPAPGPSLAVGTTADPETALLAHVYAAALRSYGTAAHVETSDDPLTALDSGAVSVVPVRSRSRAEAACHVARCRSV